MVIFVSKFVEKTTIEKCVLLSQLGDTVVGNDDADSETDLSEFNINVFLNSDKILISEKDLNSANSADFLLVLNELCWNSISTDLSMRLIEPL